MPLKEVSLNEGEQLRFKAIELGEVVRELAAQEAEKKEINEEYNGRIKLLRKRMFKLAAEMKSNG